jgi:hypothetical protein
VADKLDFGESLIGSTPKLFLHVRNESAISAHYSISADYFIAKPPTPPTTFYLQLLQNNRNILFKNYGK